MHNLPETTETAAPSTRDTIAVSRRRALAKLGLAAGVVYATPTLLQLDRKALAAATPCPPAGQTNVWRPPSCPHK
ncbi:MAG: hypothetical protein JO055_02340 [Alphaproteobacteria bacterium]|nr:hypothetical protein [Alphaproteobacteria bacterium]